MHKLVQLIIAGALTATAVSTTYIAWFLYQMPTLDQFMVANKYSDQDAKKAIVLRMPIVKVWDVHNTIDVEVKNTVDVEVQR